MGDIGRDSVVALIKQAMEDVPRFLARRGVLWGIAPATVTMDYDPQSDDRVILTLDGSTTIAWATSLVGDWLTAGQRVMVLRVPPLGMYVVGYLGANPRSCAQTWCVEQDWTSYTPAWTAVTANPAIGNGTITGSYARLGTLVVARVRILMGSTTSYGTGRWEISLPVTAASGTLDVGSVWLYDATSSTGHRPGVAVMSATDRVRLTSTTGDVATGTPIAWATSDQVRMSILYQAA